MRLLKKMISTVLVLCMIISMIPMTALAAEDSAVAAAPGRIIMDQSVLAGETTVWIDGVAYAVQTSGTKCYVDLPADANPGSMVTYSYYVGDANDVHTQYPVGMQVWALKKNADGSFTPEKIEELENILQYSGSSIRITGNKGIRMLTSIEKSKKNALVSDGLAGYKLLEYGTVLAWASNLEGGNPLVLGPEYAKYNFAYKRDEADPVFKYTGDLMQYTNVLVGFTLDQCKDDIAMRPYMILEDANGQQMTIYGGIVQRSIGYIAWQNRDVFKPGSAAYNYVWDIIRHVYAQVSFETNGGTAIETAFVQKGGTLKMPANPEREGYTFDGWYIDKAMTQAFDFTSAVNENLTLYAKWDILATIELKNFEADVWDIYIGTEYPVTFTVSVLSDMPNIDIDVFVYDENRQIIDVMNDDGKDGDAVAGDGIYTASVELYSSEVGVSEYYAETNNIQSNSFEICFYRDITENEFASFTELLNKISALSFEDACSFVANSNEILEYIIDYDNRVITYRSVYGLYGVWEEEFDANMKGNGELAIPASSGLDYDAVEQVISEVRFSPAIADKDVVVLRPFRSSEFTYDDFKTTGTLLADALGGNVTVYDDYAVTLSVMKSLSSYGTILMDSHGTLTLFSNPYMLIGEQLNEDRFLWDPIYYLQHTEYSADYLAGRIYCTGHDNRLAVGGKFFSKYYDDNTLSGSYWFLGTCYSMYNNTISDALTDAGASAVVGFNLPVSVGYCNRTLFEITLNSMLLSADTVANGIQCAKDIYGATDSNGCEIKLQGNRNFKLVDEIIKAEGTLSGKIVKASDRTTPVTTASVTVTSGNRSWVFQPDSNGTYSRTLPVGTYRIQVLADGYIDFNAYVTIEENQTIYMETFLMVEGEEGQEGEAGGIITNALTGVGLEGVRLDVRSGWNNDGTGEILTTVTTNSSGNYVVNLPIGNYTLTASKDGFVSTMINIVVQPNMCTYKNASMTPIISGDNFRIVLTWGENPRDLDSHVVGTLSNGNSFHVYFGYKSQYDGDIEVCNLDYDDTTSYGPETITLNATGSLPYYYYIYRFAGSGTVATSGAQVKVYQGGNIVATFNVPTDLGSGDYWNVFAIVNGQLVVRNTITNSSETSYASASGGTNAVQSVNVGEHPNYDDSYPAKD